MSKAIQLTIITGPHHQDHYCFPERTRCSIGRSSDCDVTLKGFPKDSTISRKHCELEIVPPAVWVRDLGSANGTFVNGKPLPLLEIDADAPGDKSFVKLLAGDVLTVGGTTMQIHVVECACRMTETAAEAEKSAVAVGMQPLEVCEDKCWEGNQRTLLADGVTVLWRE